MTKAVVHQLVHGYRKGHQFLAGSLRLSGEPGELVSRLSDLSGSTAPSTPIPPYLTLYPVKGTDFYAIARTWLDEKAPRAGCVLTHTLLVPGDVWASCNNPFGFSELLNQTPEPSEVERPLPLPAAISRKQFTPRQGPEGAADFVGAYFGAAARPVVWFDCKPEEETLWAIVTTLWPALRRRFGACTFCLQPRGTDDGPLDLMFTLGQLAPRFQSTAKAGQVRASAQAGVASVEPWVLEHTAWMFEGSPCPVVKELDDFGTLLSGEPTQLKTLYLIRTLEGRLAESAAAGVGLLDAVESLAPSPTDVTARKAHTLAAAVTASRSVSPAEALRCLFLIDERVAHPSYSGVRDTVESKLTQAVAELAEGDPALALESPGKRLASAPDESPYLTGLTKGLERCADHSPERIAVLNRHPQIAKRIILARPAIAEEYYHGAKAIGFDPTADLISWVRDRTEPDPGRQLREALLPHAASNHEAPLVAELLARIPPAEVPAVLDLLAHVTSGYEPSDIRRAVVEAVAKRYPQTTLQWASQTKVWIGRVADIVAAALPIGREGLDTVCRNPLGIAQRQAEVVAVLVAPPDSDGVAVWLPDLARTDSSFLTPLLALTTSRSRLVTAALIRCLTHVSEICIARNPEIAGLIDGSRGESYFPSLVDQTMRSVVRERLSGGIDDSGATAWQSMPWGDEWFEKVAPSTLNEVVATAVSSLPDAWGRAWGWLAHAPHPVFRRGLAADVASSLAHNGLAHWTDSVDQFWADVIARSRHECDHATFLLLVFKTLNFAFSHTHLPLGRVVAASFPTAHDVLSSSRPAPTLANLFGVLEWDKAKELRKQLIHAFVGSAWRPGDLAIAAGGEKLLRKIFNRVRRKSFSEHYIEAMARDLNARTDSAAVEVRVVFSQLLDSPDFEEPWD